MEDSLLKWYDENKREMPWRDKVLSTDIDPLNAKAYSVWVSEIMLQQTRVETVREYYKKWMKLFPTVKALSEATEDEVNATWAGLGYYSRARNMHKASKVIVNELNNKFPDNLADLLKLSGIGKYTAGAIASIAFNKVEPLVDGNIIRLFSRIFMQKYCKNDKILIDFCWKKTTKLVSKKRPGDFNQSLMELGSLICTPKKPKCDFCPLKKFCKSYKNDKKNLDFYPLPKPPKIIPIEVFDIFIILQTDLNGITKYLMKRRPTKGLLANQLEFVMILREKVFKNKTKRTKIEQISLKEELKTLCNCCFSNIFSENKQKVGTYTHVFSHLKHCLEIYVIKAKKQEEKCVCKESKYRWLSEDDMKEIGVTKSMSVCLQKVKKYKIKPMISSYCIKPTPKKVI